MDLDYSNAKIYIRDLYLPVEFEEKYKPGIIIREVDEVAASARIRGGLVQSHRYMIVSDHMKLSKSEPCCANWGMYTADKNSRFKVLDVYKYRYTVMILLYHLPDDDSWKSFEGELNSEDMKFAEYCRGIFKSFCSQRATPELVVKDWIKICSSPIGMDDDGVLYDVEF